MDRGGKLITTIRHDMLKERVRRDDGSGIVCNLIFVVGDKIKFDKFEDADDELHAKVMTYINT